MYTNSSDNWESTNGLFDPATHTIIPKETLRELMEIKDKMDKIQQAKDRLSDKGFFTNLEIVKNYIKETKSNPSTIPEPKVEYHSDCDRIDDTDSEYDSEYEKQSRKSNQTVKSTYWKCDRCGSRTDIQFTENPKTMKNKISRHYKSFKCRG